MLSHLLEDCANSGTLSSHKNTNISQAANHGILHIDMHLRFENP